MNETDQIIAELRVMDLSDVKPNYAAIGRKHGKDWRTIKRYHLGYKGKPKNRDKPSSLDKYKDEIRNKLSIKRIKVKGVYEFMIDKYGLDEIGSYSNFRYYVRKNKLKPKDTNNGGSPRYEVEPGDMIQYDWKEDVSLTSRSGEKFIVNILHMLLKFSRYSYLEITLSKDQPTLFRAIINGFKFFGGVARVGLFDNMSTAADVSVRPKKVNAKMKQFAKDIGFEVKLCKARTPKTKGSNEARNKILDWIRAYDHDFEDFEDLVGIVESINQKMNIEVCQGTDVPPALLYYKEKEYLIPLVNKSIYEPYLSQFRVKVGKDSLINYKGKRYSLDPKLIDELVTYEEHNNKLYIYYNGKLNTVHDLSDSPINYKQEHYQKALNNKVKDEDIESIAKENLKKMDNILNQRKVVVTKDDASKSIEGLMAYLSSQLHSNWIRWCYTTMSIEQRVEFHEELNKLLPYVIDEEQLFLSFKHTLDKNNIKMYRYNIFMVQANLNYTVISDEGMEVLGNEFDKEIKQEYERQYLEHLKEMEEENEHI